MPELPEVETICRALQPTLAGKCFTHISVQRENLRLPLPRQALLALADQPITGLERRAKYILIHFASQHTLLLHLGMSGRMVVDAGAAPLEKHDHVVFCCSDGTRLRFNDPRRFGVMDVVATTALWQHPLLKALGVEPLSAAFTPAYLAEKLRTRKSPIKIALMDQHCVVGVGNIYASEALFAARIHPGHSAASLGANALAALVPAVQAVLERAIAKGGSTLKDYRQANGELGYFQHEFAVYGKAGQPCPGCTCGQTIQKTLLGGRATFHCPAQQQIKS